LPFAFMGPAQADAGRHLVLGVLGEVGKQLARLGIVATQQPFARFLERWRSRLKSKGAEKNKKNCAQVFHRRFPVEGTKLGSISLPYRAKGQNASNTGDWGSGAAKQKRPRRFPVSVFCLDLTTNLVWFRLDQQAMCRRRFGMDVGGGDRRPRCRLCRNICQ